MRLMMTDNGARRYVLARGQRGIAPKWFTYAYASLKAWRLRCWLIRQGVPLRLYGLEHFQALEGRRVLWYAAAEAESMVKALCVSEGRECQAMLTPELVGLEGRRIEVQGRRVWIGRRGWPIPQHYEALKPEAKKGRRAKGSYESLQVIE